MGTGGYRAFERQHLEYVGFYDVRDATHVFQTEFGQVNFGLERHANQAPYHFMCIPERDLAPYQVISKVRCRWAAMAGRLPHAIHVRDDFWDHVGERNR